MSERWFRLYEGVVHDPKLQKLPGEVFKGLINLWCIASSHGGALPPIDDLSFTLRMPVKKVEQMISALHEAGLIDDVDGSLRPHNWNGRQFKSDVSTPRVKQYRERHKERRLAVTRNGDETLHETPPETEQRQTQSSEPNGSASQAPPDEWSEPSDRERLFGGGLAWLAKTTGKPERSCRALLGGWLKKTGDDATAILELLRQAKDRRLAEPVAWIEAALKPRPNGVNGHGEPPADWPARAGLFERTGMWLIDWGDARDIPAEFRPLFPETLWRPIPPDTRSGAASH